MSLELARTVGNFPSGHTLAQRVVAITVLESEGSFSDSSIAALLRRQLAEHFPGIQLPPRRKTRPPSDGGSGVREGQQKAAAPPGKKPLELACGVCGHVWTAIWLPMERTEAARILRAACCPVCGGTSNSVVGERYRRPAEPPPPPKQ